MVNLDKVREFERAKQNILKLAEDKVHTQVLLRDGHQMQSLLMNISKWIEAPNHKSSGIIAVCTEELKYCSAVQHALVLRQQILFRELLSRLHESIDLLNERELNLGTLEKSGILTKIHILIEKILLNSTDVLTAAGVRTRAAA